MPDSHVIVGAGLAGSKTAEALREEGFDGRIVLLGAEPEPPYDRPPLSKDYLRGESPREQGRVHPANFYAAQDIELRTSTVVEGIDTAGRSVSLGGGERIDYDRLLLATGAEPRRLSVPGADLEGIHYLRDLADADRIAARLATGGHVVVIGAGWIGLEVAACARARGLEVTVVERAEVPLEPVLGREVGGIFAQLHRDGGVELLTGVGLDSFEGTGAVERVRLSDGRCLDADFVVAGIGVMPRVKLAWAAGLDVDNGILVDKRLETSSAGVFAAGDVANAFHPFYRRPLRVEHWANALNQPVTAARAMLGKPASHDHLPFFFSDQYDMGMEYAGRGSPSDEVVFRGDVASRQFIAFWLQDGCVTAGMNVNVWDVTEDIQALIRSRRRIDPTALRDPDIALLSGARSTA